MFLSYETLQKQLSFSNKSHFITRKGKYIYNKRNEMFIVYKSLHLLIKLPYIGGKFKQNKG